MPDEKAVAAQSVSSGLTAIVPPGTAGAAAARINAILASKGIIAKVIHGGFHAQFLT